MNKSYIDIMRGLREDNDKTQQDIADFLGISQTMYARYERGANELPIRHLIKLCQYYHVSADYFLGLSKYVNKKVNHVSSTEVSVPFSSMLFLRLNYSRNSI